MKKLLCTSIILLAALSIHGQELEKAKETKNEIGIMLTDILNGTIQLKYERLLGDHISVSLGIGYKGNDGILNLSGLDTDQIKTADINYKGRLLNEVGLFTFHIKSMR